MKQRWHVEPWQSDCQALSGTVGLLSCSCHATVVLLSVLLSCPLSYHCRCTVVELSYVLSCPLSYTVGGSVGHCHVGYDRRHVLTLSSTVGHCHTVRHCRLLSYCRTITRLARGLGGAYQHVMGDVIMVCSNEDHLLLSIGLASGKVHL